MGTLQENRTLDYEEEKNKRIRILEERLEEYQKYIDINHKEIERLGNELQVQIEDNVRLNEYIEEQDNIIKEAREYCENNKEFTDRLNDIIEILKGEE